MTEWKSEYMVKVIKMKKTLPLAFCALKEKLRKMAAYRNLKRSLPLVEACHTLPGSFKIL